MQRLAFEVVELLISDAILICASITHNQIPSHLILLLMISFSILDYFALDRLCRLMYEILINVDASKYAKIQNAMACQIGLKISVKIPISVCICGYTSPQNCNIYYFTLCATPLTGIIPVIFIAAYIYKNLHK